MSFYCPNCWAEVAEEAEVCPACGRSLAVKDEDYVDKLIAALRHFEPTRAALAVQILSEMLAEPRAIGPLIDLVGTADDAYVLHSAVRALGRFADARAVPVLVQRVLSSKTPLVVRVAAVEALARIGGDEARAAIRRATDDPSAVVRDRAHQALDRLQEP